MEEFREVYNDGTMRLLRSEHGWRFEMPPAATTLMVREGKLILIQDKKTDNDHWLWSFPGGMIEKGETTEQAAARECEEETGLIPTTLEMFASVPTDFPGTRVDYFIGSDLQQGQQAPWVATGSENIGLIQEFTWPEVYDFALHYQLRDPRLVVAVLLLANQPEVLKKYRLI
jgi:mutator protein MutT